MDQVMAAILTPCHSAQTRATPEISHAGTIPYPWSQCCYRNAGIGFPGARVGFAVKGGLIMMKRITLACLGLVLVSAAYAQQPEAQKLERIEVTGSSIKRLDAETALPVQIIRRADIERIGAVSTEELLRQVTAITSAGSITVSQANGTVTTSQSAVALRALGSTRTLVLVNGRRVAVFGGTTSTAVDVNSIPISAIERIEVLKDGASSLYGSDAIAGVVNFILRRDYTGAEATVSYGSPTQSGGGADTTVSAYFGMGTLDKNGWNFNMGAGYEKQDR